MAVERERLDVLLVARGLAASRERARALILAGRVLGEERVLDKAGVKVPVDIPLRLKGEDIPFVGRGGLKLAAALDAFELSPLGCVALDVGASTGGFTHCLLQRGVRRVYAVDVGYGQLAWEVRQDERVVVMDRTNIRHLRPADLPEVPDFAVVDVSFISLDLVLPVVRGLVAPAAVLVALVKPQFEVGRGAVGKGGIVRDAAARQWARDRVVTEAVAGGWEWHGTIDSPITGQKGNREYLICLRRHGALTPAPGS
ncbi:MAG: TlyA family RNA methyltransferase [Deltaproteobacteria bacterium]|nr:TlyA family RNA methyltransferase [Candidatus Anaeroferrophillacea bacterium]